MQDQAKKLNRPRATAPVNSKLDKALVAYMAAAAAAMFTTSAQAKVVYTPANSSTTFGSIPIDLNNDGVVDFYDFCHRRVFSFGTNGCEASGRGQRGVGGSQGRRGSGIFWCRGWTGRKIPLEFVLQLWQGLADGGCRDVWRQLLVQRRLC